MQRIIERVDALLPFQGEITPDDYNALLGEIGATPESLKRDAKTLREWCSSQSHLPNLTSKYDKWLEKFVTVSKNSMEKAKQRLDNYLKNRNILADWFVLPPPSKEDNFRYLTQFMRTGFMPKVLPGGYILFIEQINSTHDGDWSRFDLSTRFQMGVMVTDLTLAVDRKFCGCVYILDVKALNVDWVTSFLGSLGKARKFISCVQGSMPMRIQALHIVNAIAPSILRTVLNALTPMLKDKLAQRIYIHDNMKSLHDAVPAEYLPKLYGGTNDVSMKELAESNMDMLFSCREFFESRTWMKSDEERRPNKAVSEYGVEGSFRKLAVD